MKVPLMLRIGALVLATTAFYAYVGQMVPQKEVQPPQETVLENDLTTADMVKVGREIMEGKGLCLTCHTIGKSGALRFPDLDGVAARAKSRVPGLSDVEYFAQSLYEPDAFVVPGFNPGMPADQQASDRSHRSGDPLRDRVPPDAGRHADGHAPDDSPVLRRRHRRARRHRGWRLPTRKRAGRGVHSASGYTMNILVVLAVAVAFGLLRFRRVNLLMWAGAWWVGIYVLLRFGFTAPIPSSVISLSWESSRSRSWRTCPRARSAAKKSPARSSGS